MEKRMERSLIYNGTITAEQFLFYEIRIASKYYLDGASVEDAIEEIKKNNLFQYPTERLVARMVRSCYKRLDALEDEQLRQELSSAPAEIAKQINLYAMMRYNRIVWDFMVGVIGEKFRSQDFEFSRKDLNVFFSHLQEQNDDIAGWSESTVNNLTEDGSPLYDKAFSTSSPYLILNSLQTESEKNQQKGFCLMLKGINSMVRNVTAHTPKIKWIIDEDEAVDILMTISFLHKNLDSCQVVRMEP